MHFVTVTFLPQLCLGMSYQHSLSNNHQLNASNPGWQNLHLQVPSLLIVVFISHTHTPLFHLYTVLHCHTVLHNLAVMHYFLFFSFFFLRRGWSPCTAMLSWALCIIGIINNKIKRTLLPRDAMHKRGLRCRVVSICLSVTFVYCVKTSKHILKNFFRRVATPLLCARLSA